MFIPGFPLDSYFDLSFSYAINTANFWAHLPCNPMMKIFAAVTTTKLYVCIGRGSPSYGHNERVYLSAHLRHETYAKVLKKNTL